jgi:magnesium transporter
MAKNINEQEIRDQRIPEEQIERIRQLIDDSALGEVRKILEPVGPEDIAEVLREFSFEQKFTIFNLLDLDKAAVVLDDTDPQTRLQLLQKLEPRKLGRILGEMPVDEAADVIEDIPEKEREDVLELMREKDAEEVEEILSYPEDSAARVMNPNFVSVKDFSSVEDAVSDIRDQKTEEDIFYVYVVDNAMRLKGTIPLARLITARRGTLVRDIMDEDAHYARVMEDQERAAHLMKKYDVYALPVVDENDRLVGRITADDIIDVMDEERAEDMSRMTGTMEEEQGTETTGRATQNRLPWLITCMLGSILTGLVIQMFEVTLAEMIALVSFIPVVTATGGNSGVQASTVVVRELALGTMDMGKTAEEVWRQLKIALSLGFICGIVLTLLANFWKKDTMVGAIVGVSIFLVVVWSNVVGVIIPTVFRRLNIDPAIASGPLITTLNDVVGVFIYLSVATLLLT